MLVVLTMRAVVGTKHGLQPAMHLCLVTARGVHNIDCDVIRPLLSATDCCFHIVVVELC